MPWHVFQCETCGKWKRRYKAPGYGKPRFCGRECMTGKPLKPEQWPITPEIHARIEKIYKRDTGNGQVKALARSLGYPRWKITRYALKQGWTAKSKKEPPWSEDELEILQKHTYLGAERLQRKLKLAGFKRSFTGIVLKRKRMGFSKYAEGYSAHALASYLGVDHDFVTRAIKAGRLKAKRRGTRRVKAQGGDSFYVSEKAVRDYILTYLNEIDIRKVEKHWFVGVLTKWEIRTQDLVG